MTKTKDKTLDDFATTSSRRLFHILGMPDSFFEMDTESRNYGADFKIARDVICSLATTNN